MVTVSKLGTEVDQISVKIGKDKLILTENSNSIILYKALKELSRVILQNQLRKKT